jgi:hypothetical protein
VAERTGNLRRPNRELNSPNRESIAKNACASRSSKKPEHQKKIRKRLVSAASKCDKQKHQPMGSLLAQKLAFCAADQPHDCRERASGGRCWFRHGGSPFSSSETVPALLGDVGGQRGLAEGGVVGPAAPEPPPRLAHSGPNGAPLRHGRPLHPCRWHAHCRPQPLLRLGMRLSRSVRSGTINRQRIHEDNDVLCGRSTTGLG